MKLSLNKLSFVTCILWATAIVATAILGAPRFLTLILLPTLAVVSLIFTTTKGCTKTVAGDN